MDRRGLLGGLLAAVATRAVADPSDCPPGTVWVRDERKQEGNDIYITPVCRKAPQPAPATPCATLRREMAVLRTQMKADSQQAQSVSDAVDEWAKLLDDQRDEARKEGFALAKEAAFEAITHLIHTGAVRDRMITAQDAGLLHSNWKTNTVRLIQMPADRKAAVLTRLSQARTVEQGVTALRYGNQAIDAAYHGGVLKIERNWADAKAASVSLLRLLELITYDNPYTALLVLDFRAGANAATGWYAVLAARNRIRQFAALEDGALARSIDRANRYVAAADKLRANPCVA